jgi:hypothetical protein
MTRSPHRRWPMTLMRSADLTAWSVSAGPSACLQADMRWCEDTAVQSVLCLSERKFAPRVERLRVAVSFPRLSGHLT